MRIQGFARVTGVSVRTLHYYDEIGLLKPSYVDKQTGYRHYDESSLERMQEILFYRELGFPLRQICEILTSPEYDREAALSAQRQLLILKKQRLERMIAALDERGKGAQWMKAFDNTDYEAHRAQYAAEARQKWGETDAYAEYEARAASRSDTAMDGLNDIFGQFAYCMESGAKPEDEEAQELVRALQAFITANYYTCSKKILAGLGAMYTADERFQKNIDRHADGTAAFVSEAIRHYCQ